MRHLPMFLAPIALSALVCSACGGLNAAEMVPDGLQVGDPQPGSVRVEAVGMKPVGGDELAAAVASSITASNLFETLADPGAEDCDWVLSVTVTDVDRDDASLTMTSKATFAWSLRAPSAEHAKWSQTIVTKFTATPDDTDYVEERGRIATTHAVKENIQRALAAVSELELD